LTWLKDHTSPAFSTTLSPLKSTIFSILPNNKTICLQKQNKNKKTITKKFCSPLLTPKPLFYKTKTTKIYKIYSKKDTKN
jgi:hypothetical protein